MSRASLRAESRETGRARANRRDGYVPAVVYGQDREPLSLKMLRSDVDRLLNQQSGHGLLDLELEGGTDTVMVRDIQRDPVRGDVLHMDLYRVSMRERIQTRVPMSLVGDEQLSRAGAVVQQHLWEIEIECLPGDIPDSISADVSDMEVGDTLTIGDLLVPEGVVLLPEADQVVATVSIPRVLKSTAAAAGEDGEVDEDAEGEPEDGDESEDQE